MRRLNSNIHNTFHAFWARFFIVVICVSLVAQTSTSMMAHGKTDSGQWIEICADGGTYLMDITGNTDAPSSDCAHCDICLPAVTELTFVHPLSLEKIYSGRFETYHARSTSTNFVTATLGLWPIGRDPPIGEKMQNNNETIQPWSASWV